MDARFLEMLKEAEQIRAKCRQTGMIGPHGKHMADMMRYAKEHGLYTGDVLAGTASEECLTHAAEMAAGMLEIIHGEQVGSVLTLSREEKIALSRRAI